ncbi:MAG: hypothetical protein D4R83_01155 [Streptomycetaceae bacterium]|nr:MAG: hypothetical protein D4R83_01155 [Streptomycetaceae bacterium]
MKYASTPKELKGLRHFATQFGAFLETSRKGARENLDFGNLFIMNEYAQVPIGTKILGRLQHGSVPLSVAKAGYNNNLHSTYVWNFEAEKFANTLGWQNFHTVGAPWIYLLELQKSMGLNQTLVDTCENRPIDELWIYANHSNYIDDGFESGLDSFLSAASQSNASEKLILLFWYDYIKLSPDIRSRYPQLRIITLGDRAKCSTANAHLFQLHGILTRTKSVVIDFPGTPFFYALSVGCKVIWLKNSNFASGLVEANLIESGELVKAMTEEVVEPSQYRQLVCDNLGLDHIKSPAEIRRLFHWNLNGLILLEALMVTFTTLSCAPFRFIKNRRISFE